MPRWIDSPIWRRLRAKHLRHYPHCAWCGAHGPRGMTVDHVIPRSVRPDLALDLTNLQTLCGACHGEAKQTHERQAGDVLASGSTEAGWPVDPHHPWNMAATAPAKARLTPRRK